MRIVGTRKIRPIGGSPSADQLLRGALFNDEIHRLPTGTLTRIPKGVYRYKTHEEANADQDRWLCDLMLYIRNERKNGTNI